MRKKGEESTSAVGVATLLAIIAAFMVIYILLLPQEAREDLLYGNETNGYRTRGTGVIGEDVLFSEFLGELSPIKKVKDVKHSITAVNLFSTSKKDISTLSNAIIISRGFLSTKSQTLMFELDNPRDVQDAQIYILVGKSEGNLIAVLNGNIILNDDLLDNSQKIIKLPLNYLMERNILELISSKPGFIFGSNVHEIEYVKLKKDYVLKNRIAERVFSVPINELKYVERAIMGYAVYCNLEESNVLRMFLNGYLIFSDVPFCNLRNENIEIDSSYFVPGPNNLRFETDGDYIIEGIEIKTITDEERVPEYYFDIDREDYMDVARGSRDVIASFDFSVRSDRKVMDLFINDREIRIDTTKAYYDIIISGEVESGVNIFRIEPKSTFEVVDFRIEIV